MLKSSTLYYIKKTCLQSLFVDQVEVEVLIQSPPYPQTQSEEKNWETERNNKKRQRERNNKKDRDKKNPKNRKRVKGNEEKEGYLGMLDLKYLKI